MTAKRKITDKNGVQVFPITHTKAVLDDNGNSVEQRLQENLDLINQKQLEVGAVPSDVTPTEGSTNWVTSGGVYEEIYSPTKNVFKDSSTYSDDISELYLTKDTYRVNLRQYSGKIVAVGFDGNNNQLWATSYSVTSSDNNKVLEMVIASTNDENYKIGFPILYVVFSNITHFLATSVGSVAAANDINILRAKLLHLQPTIMDSYYFTGVNNYVPIKLGKNLYDPSNISINRYINKTTGAVTAVSSTYKAAISNYVAVNGNNLVCNRVHTSLSNAGWAAYDEYKTLTHSGSGSVYQYQSGDYFVRFTVNYGFDDIQIEEGDTSTSYEPYGLIMGYDVNLSDGKVKENNLSSGCVTNSKIATKTITVDKLYDCVKENGKNLLNLEEPDCIYDGSRKYIRYDTGNVATYTNTDNNKGFGVSGYIPIDSEGLITNCYGGGAGYLGYAYYNSEKEYISGAVHPNSRAITIPYIDGASYVRITLSNITSSDYEDDELMVCKGTQLGDYEPSSERNVISREVLPSANISNGSITESMLSNSYLSKQIESGIEICLPDEIPIVVGDTLRVYYRSIVTCPNPYIWDIYAVSKYGKSYPRYYLFTPTSAGTRTVTFYVKTPEGTILASKQVSIKAINAMSSPSSNKNVLLLGASMLADGVVASELKRRLTTTSGSNTPINPTGIGLSNITFVGSKSKTYNNINVNLEATGGWSWYDYSTDGRLAYRFYVSNVGLLQIGDKYRDSNSNYEFTIEEINVTDGEGNIRCTYTGSGTIGASGTLTLVTGTGDSTITYSSYSEEGKNPFWNTTTGELDFTSYANTYCNGSIDVILAFAGFNDFTGLTEENLSTLIDNRIKPFVRAYHDEFPNGLFLHCSMYLGSVNGGMAASYGASGTWNYYTAARKEWKYAKMLREMASDPEFSSYVKIVETLSELDSETLYPTGEFTVANRSSVTETLQTNGVHTSNAGKYTIADSMYEAINYILG